jgi:hypothetical protein
VIAESLSANGAEAIDALTAIDGFSGSKDARLWGELQHDQASKKLRTMAATESSEA